MERKDTEDILYEVVEELPMENIVYDDVHTSATDIPMDNIIIIVSCGNICYDNAAAIKSELAINNSNSKDALCCDQVPKPVSVGVNIHRTEVIRDGRRDYLLSYSLQ